MGFGKKHDYPPMLAPGRHVMSLTDIKKTFVEPFHESDRRRNLFHKLEEFVQTLLVAHVACEVWLDGSFVTDKVEPDDLDVTAIIDPDVMAAASPDQAELLQRIADSGFADGLDSFMFVKRSREDPFFGDDLLDPAYSWGGQYGLECSERYLKGFVVLKLRETNVGLRLCS